MNRISSLKTKIFFDGSDKTLMMNMYRNPLIQGFTTNPTLMRKAGVTSYQGFALDVLKTVTDRPISFEVFSDDFDDMYEQAMHISRWGQNVYVKIPVMNTQGKPAYDLIKKLAQKGVKQNVTALMTTEQVQHVTEALSCGPDAFISIFAGRIADTGRDPLPLMRQALTMMCPYEQLSLIWASPRELLNVFQADLIGCHVITVTNDILRKIDLIDKDLTQYSLETVEMFYTDATAAGYTLDTNSVREPADVIS